MIENIKTITETEIDENGVCSAPDVLVGTAEENKRVFDKLCRNIIIPRLNKLIEEASILEKSVSDDAELGAKLKEMIEALSKDVGDVSAIEGNGSNVAEKINNLRELLFQMLIEMTQKVGELGRLKFFSTSVVNALNYLYEMVAPGAISYAPKLPEASEENLMNIFRVFDVDDQKHRLYICKASFPEDTGFSVGDICGRIYFDPYTVKERFSAYRKKHIDYFSAPVGLKQHADILTLKAPDDETDTISLRIKYSTSLDGFVLGVYKGGEFTSLWSSDNFKLDGISYDPGYLNETYTDLCAGYEIKEIMPDLSWLIGSEDFQSVFFWEELGAGANQKNFDVSVSKTGRYSTLTVSSGDNVKSVNIEDGLNGYTPIKKVDYFTDEEIEEISYAIENNLRNDIVTSSGIELEFVNDISECIDTSKLYVLPDNFIYAYTKKEKSRIPNAFDLSNGSSINNRINSAGVEVASDGYALTGFIDLVPENKYDIVIEGINIVNTYGMGLIICIYNSDKGYVERTHLTTSDFAAVDGTYTIHLNELFSSKWSNAIFVRIAIGVGLAAITEDDVRTLYAAITPENYERYEYSWGNTNHAFIPTEYETIISELSEKINENTLDIGFLEKRVFGKVDEVYPYYWDDAVADVVETINNKRKAAGINSVSFAFFSDNHQRLGSSCAMIGDVMRKCNLPYAFFCGDAITNGITKDLNAMVEQEEKFFALTSAIPDGRFCRALGNHDGYYCDSEGGQFHRPWEERYSLFLAPLSTSQNKVFGGNGTYYYVDDTASKTRFIVLNSVWFAYDPVSEGVVYNSDGYGFGQEQITWLKDVLLSLPDGYDVAFFSHSPISNDAHSCIRDARIVQGILNAFAVGGTFEGEYSIAYDSANNCSVSVTFPKAGNIIGWFSGHIHRDRIITADAHNGSPLNFKCVTITSDANIPYDPEEPKRDLNGPTGHAVDFVNVNKNTGEVFIKRLGIGSNRMYYYK